MTGAAGLAPRRGPLALRLPLALVPLLVLLGAAEFALGLLGLGEVAGPPPAGRSFDPTAAAFVRDGDGWRTQIFGDAAREIVIPPRDGRRRVLLIGGSNVQVFPQRHLQALLDGATPGGPGWEIVNLGREGYGSARELILLEQALPRLRPDLVVIYSVHNEFVERGFALELHEAAVDAGPAVALLAYLRSFRALEQAFRPALPPAPLDRADPGAREIPWATTEAYYAALEQNLLRMCDAAARHDVRVLLCTVVSNHLAPPYVSTLPADLAEADRLRFEELHEAGLIAIPRPFREGLRPPVRLRLSSWTRGAGLSPEQDAAALPALRPLLGALADAPAWPVDGGEDATLAGRHWPPPSGWEPEVLPLLTAIDRLLRRELNGAQRASVEKAVPLLEQALAIVPDHPLARFDLGLAQWLAGADDAQAVATLAAAQSADRSPHSGNRLSNDLVRRVVAARPAARLLDAERLFAERCPAGLVTYEIMMDACHLQPGARRVLMADLSTAILQGFPW